MKIFRNIIRRRWFSHTFTLEVTGTDICDTRIGSKHFTPMSSASNIYISRYFPFEYLLTFIPSKSTFYTPKVLFVFFTSLLPTFILLLFSLCYFANFFLSFLKQQKIRYVLPFHSKYKSVLPAPPQGHTACQISQISCEEIISLLFVLLHKF